MKHRIWRTLLAGLMIANSAAAIADKQDSTQPMKLRSDRAALDDYKKTYDYLGSVHMTQGTRALTADRLLIKEDAAGFHQNTAFGRPEKLAHIKQRESQNKGWMEGWAQRIEYDDRTDKFYLYDQARIKTSNDEAQGEVIIYDNLTERYQVLSKGQALPEVSKPLPAQPAAAAHAPQTTEWVPAPSKATLPSSTAPPVSTNTDGRAKAVINPGK